MNVLYLIAAILAVLGGFIGLIIIIKGFVDKSDKGIKLGTILVIGLIIALSGAFCVGQRAIRMAKHHAWYREMMMQKNMRECNFDMMEGCEKGDSACKDTSCIKKCTKVIIEKNCDKKMMDGKCKQGMH